MFRFPLAGFGGRGHQGVAYGDAEVEGCQPPCLGPSRGVVICSQHQRISNQVWLMQAGT